MDASFNCTLITRVVKEVLKEPRKNDTRAIAFSRVDHCEALNLSNRLLQPLLVASVAGLLQRPGRHCLKQWRNS